MPGKPWHRIFEVEQKPQSLIPYALALDAKLDSVTQEQADQIDAEDRELLALFK